MSADFQAAADWLSTNPAAAQLPDGKKLELYGLYKYVVTGGGPPGIFSITARAKHDAWQAATQHDQAEQRYIDIAKGLGWTGIKADKGRGVRVSTMEGDQDDPSIEMQARMNETDYVHSRDENGSTPLHIAADRGLLSVAQMLLARGADPNSKDNDEQTPLDIAILLQRNDLTRLLSAATHSSLP